MPLSLEPRATVSVLIIAGVFIYCIVRICDSIIKIRNIKKAIESQEDKK